MKMKKYNYLSDDVIRIRQMVFIEEQGFQNEFDNIDEIATHIVMYNQNNEPIATCRIFKDKEKDVYILGRLAVIKQYRDHHIGSKIVEEAEKIVISEGGKSLCLHAQCRVKNFYTKLGFVEYGQEDDDEGCPHIWMKKQFFG